MALPSWQDKKFGSMIRAALWLESEVGEGEIFTKTRLREAFPEVTQIDRRIRDLRSHDWQIDTARDDPSLRLEEQRYVKRGALVWLPGTAKSLPKASLTAAQRSKVLQDDNFLCRTCGAAAGDTYEDGVLTAQLDVARRNVRLPDGSAQIQLITQCNRCRVGSRVQEVDLSAVLDALQALTNFEREILARWIETDRRKLNELEKLWGAYRALPADSRAVVKRTVLDHGA